MDKQITISLALSLMVGALVTAMLIGVSNQNQPPVGDIPLQTVCFEGNLPETNFKDRAFRLSNELK